MKKLLLVLTVALFCMALATPVYGDVLSPGWRFLYSDGWIYLLIAIAVLILGVILHKLLKKRK